MPTWGEILQEVNLSAQQRAPNGPDLDGIRGKYINALHSLTENAVIVYASSWLQWPRGDPAHQVEGRDVHALMEVCHGVRQRSLDFIIHSPGGSAEAAEQMINYLRTRFDYIRAIVPLQAKSAGTMLALGCDEIIIGTYSELGPIDPQITYIVGGAPRQAPAHAILRDFSRAKAEVAGNVNLLGAWTPILATYAGGLIEYCTQQIQLSRDIVAGWVERYMLSHSGRGIPRGQRGSAAAAIAEYFCSDESYDRFRTHGRPIRIEELEGLRGFRVRRLNADQALQDAVLSIYHALDFTFLGPFAKIVENHISRRVVRPLSGVAFTMGSQPASPSPPASP
jgi:hypothetical protein